MTGEASVACSFASETLLQADPSRDVRQELLEAKWSTLPARLETSNMQHAPCNVTHL